MDNNIENEKIKERIEEFCKQRNLENHLFVKECITDFIEGHTRLYGDVVSTDELFSRLETNLEHVLFDRIEDSYDGEIAAYVSSSKNDNIKSNSIYIYSSESNLDLSEVDKQLWNAYPDKYKQKLIKELNDRKSETKSIILHELTHAAYTIKGSYGDYSKHIFSTVINSPSMGNFNYMGDFNDQYVEAIVNYISSRIEGRKSNELLQYKEETRAIYMLAEHVDEKKIISAAWNSNEEQYKQAYIEAIGKGEEFGEKSYNEFKKGMEQLIIGRNHENSEDRNLISIKNRQKELLSNLQQIFNGERMELEHSEIKEFEQSQKNETESWHELPKIAFEELKLSVSQRIANFLGKHQNLMKIPFLKKYVDRKLNLLPSANAQQEENNVSSINADRLEFINEISNNEKYRNLEPLQHNEDIQNIEPLKKLNIEENER